MEKSAIYKEDLTNDDVAMTIGIPDNEAMNVIPVSVIVKSEPGKNLADLYNTVFQKINEADLGLAEYYPYKGKLLMNDDGNLCLDLENGHHYDAGSTAEITFLKTLHYFKYQQLNEIYLLENSKPGVYLSHTGKKIYEFPLDEWEKTGFMLYKSKDRAFFTPSPNSHESIADALQEMRLANETYKWNRPSPPTFL